MAVKISEFQNVASPVFIRSAWRKKSTTSHVKRENGSTVVWQNGFHMIVTDFAAWLMKASPSLQYYQRFINKQDVAGIATKTGIATCLKSLNCARLSKTGLLLCLNRTF